MSDVIAGLAREPRLALEALAVFRFLTVQQMVRLGVCASDTVARDYVVSRLERRARPLAKSKKLNSFLPKVHYMTKHGAEELAAMYKIPVESFRYPKGQVQFGDRLARHRFAQVDFHISLRLWASQRGDIDILGSAMDFDVAGSRKHNNFTQLTEIPLPNKTRPVIADGLFAIKANDTPVVYALEVHRTSQTKQVARQIEQYMEVLETGALGFKIGIKVSPFICSVHTNDAVMRGVKKHLLNVPYFPAFKGAFVFNTMENLAGNFSDSWTFADDKPANPFPALTQQQTQKENLLEDLLEVGTMGENALLS